jgi:RimJ/RimL family protein N-acetyltransferase
MIELRRMSENEYSNYLQHSIPDYAREKEKSEGFSKSEALALATQGFQSLLPQGLKTRDQFLFTICEKNSGESVGILWFGIKESPRGRQAYLYDFEMNAEHRGKGYGTQALKLFEAEVKNLGMDWLSLHVFGHNEKAQKLYSKMGFRPTSIFMAKKI